MTTVPQELLTSFGEAPTDRCALPPKFGVKPEAFTGIDTIRVSGPYADHRLERLTDVQDVSRDTGEQREIRRTAGGSLVLPSGVTVWLKADERTRSLTCEFSAARVFGVTNRIVATAPEAAQAVEAVYDLASNYVEWACDWHQVQVHRLDLTRDFLGVRRRTQVLRALGTPALRKGRSRWIYVSHERGGGLSVVVAPKKGWRLCGYDKAAQLHDESKAGTGPRHAELRRQAGLAQMEGRLRIETRLRPEGIRKHFPNRAAGHVLASDLDSIAHHYFVGVGFDRWTPDPSAVCDKIAFLDSIAGTQAATVKEMLLHDALGIPQRASRNTLDRARRLARDAGLTAEDFRCGETTRSVRLDWHTGSLVEGGAA